jgi:DNA (cytosine-5)-methyltransferase 1
MLSGKRWEKVHNCCRRVFDENGLSPTLDTMNGGYREPKIFVEETAKKEGVVIKIGNSNKEIVEYGSYYTWEDNKGNINTQCNRTANEDNCALTVACSQTGNVFEKNLRIRKLTPRECGRLMGVSDDDITKMSQNQSDSSLYHLFGDSIVVDVLYYIFKQMM